MADLQAKLIDGAWVSYPKRVERDDDIIRQTVAGLAVAVKNCWNCLRRVEWKGETRKVCKCKQQRQTDTEKQSMGEEAERKGRRQQTTKGKALNGLSLVNEVWDANGQISSKQQRASNAAGEESRRADNRQTNECTSALVRWKCSSVDSFNECRLQRDGAKGSVLGTFCTGHCTHTLPVHAHAKLVPLE